MHIFNILYRQILHIDTSRTMIFTEIPLRKIPMRKGFLPDLQITSTTKPMPTLTVS